MSILYSFVELYFLDPPVRYLPEERFYYVLHFFKMEIQQIRQIKNSSLNVNCIISLNVHIKSVLGRRYGI
jgi:hypothetical protein